MKEREAGKEFDLVDMQLTKAFKDIAKEDAVKITVAYEPIWAIGTGKVASREQANQMCGHIRSVLSGIYDDKISSEITIQYGGSVKPENAREILGMEQIDGALVGGASLKPDSFAAIIECYA